MFLIAERISRSRLVSVRGFFSAADVCFDFRVNSSVYFSVFSPRNVVSVNDPEAGKETAGDAEHLEAEDDTNVNVTRPKRRSRLPGWLADHELGRK